MATEKDTEDRRNATKPSEELDEKALEEIAGGGTSKTTTQTNKEPYLKVELNNTFITS